MSHSRIKCGICVASPISFSASVKEKVRVFIYNQVKAINKVHDLDCYQKPVAVDLTALEYGNFLGARVSFEKKL